MLKTYSARSCITVLLALLFAACLHTTVSAASNTLSFTEDDYKSYQELATPSRSNEYQPVLALLKKLYQTDPDNFHLTSDPEVTYDYLLHDLEQRKSTIESIRIKMESINNQLENQQDMLNTPSSRDKELIDYLINDISTLTPQDQKKIDDYPLLLQAQKKITPDRRSQLLWIILIMVLLLALPIGLKFYKLHRHQTPVK